MRFFKYLKYLTIIKMKVEFFERDTFNELNKLQNLTLNNMPIKWINKELLWPMKDSLINLTINQFYEVNLYNLTGCIQLTVLKILNIQNSQIRSIGNNSLQGLLRCSTLILHNCSIQFIANESFRTITETLVYIDLRANFLTVVCENLFHQFLSTVGMTILIDKNPWNCSLLSNNLIETVNNYSNIFDMYLCGKSTTTEITSVSTTISSTTEEENVIESTTKKPNSCNNNIFKNLRMKIYLSILLLQFLY